MRALVGLIQKGNATKSMDLRVRATLQAAYKYVLGGSPHSPEGSGLRARFQPCTLMPFLGPPAATFPTHILPIVPFPSPHTGVR
jgi:hypothetical protein